MKRIGALIALLGWLTLPLAASERSDLPTLKPVLETPLQLEQLDPETFAEWIDGTEKPFPDEERHPEWFTWTGSTKPRIPPRRVFGASRMPGPRHLRIGFHTSVPVGSVATHGGGTLSLLKPEAVYPGDLNNDNDWIPAQSLVRGEIARPDIGDLQYALWTLPPGVETRALRFTHTAAPADSKYAGVLGTLLISEERFSNIASEATFSASFNSHHAERLANGDLNTFDGWENFTQRGAIPDSQLPITPERPEWVVLTWPAPVKIAGLDALGAGFGAAEIQIYTGPASRHPRDAGEGDWKSVARYTGITSGYPIKLWPNRLMLPEVVITRAIRLKITEPLSGDKNAREGRRIWLGELMVLSPLEDAPLTASASETRSEKESHPPIPVRFELSKPGFVTLVIEDESGKRVRNLVSETPFPAGKNVAWWDGADDLGRDLDAPRHGLYRIPAQFVAPGKYRVRGLVRDAIVPHFEFSVYSTGHPTWPTPDSKGGWLTNHTPPQAAMFLPAALAPDGVDQIFLGSYVAEGGSGLAWVDLDGKKLGGRGWVGGIWTGAPFLACDQGSKRVPEIYAYVGASWQKAPRSKTGTLRLNGLTPKGDRPLLSYDFEMEDPSKMMDELAGLAVHDGILVASLPLQKKLLVGDVRTSKVLWTAPLEESRGLAFDREGRLLVLAGKKLLRYSLDPANGLGAPVEVVGKDLEDPRGITLDSAGNLYISDGGTSHQVKVFRADGKLLRTVGRPGAPKAGPYDPLHMNHPTGMAIDANGRLWVAEKDYLPKRVSVWNPDGTLWKAFYGPAKYGGGGTLDSQDKRRFYYADEGRGAMEFELDWEKGTSELKRVYYRPEPGDLPLAFNCGAPELPLSYQGKRYFTNSYNSHPTGGHGVAFLFVERDGLARPIAAVGRAGMWDLLKTEPFASRIPQGLSKRNETYFLWSDANEDHQAQPEEVTIRKGTLGTVAVMPDLSFCVTRIDDKAYRFAPSGHSSAGLPLYDIEKGEILVEGVPPGAGGAPEILVGKEGRTILTTGIAPFAQESFSGAKDGKPNWSYPNLWPGLHRSHEAPKPSFPGELIGPTRLLGGFVTPKGSDAGEIWAINANMGTVYLFTSDGLFVATLFKDKRIGKPWSMPFAERNMKLDELTIGEENFWPTWAQTSDGKVYLMDGARTSLVRLDGLESIRRLPDSLLNITISDLQKAHEYLVESEANRQQENGSGILKVSRSEGPIIVDGKLDEWGRATWVDIDKRGVAASFNSTSKPYDVTAAVSLVNGRLYAAFRTGDKALLQNTGEVPLAPFKTGGALDLMLGVNPKADPHRTAAAEGDLRLLVTQVKGKTKAMLYRPVVPGTKEGVPFSSPWRTVLLDRVDDVSHEVELAGADGNFEISIPLALLGWNPHPGQTMKGDIGILRGDGIQTTARVYWSNKATGITADVPSEATLTPALWGNVEVH